MISKNKDFNLITPGAAGGYYLNWAEQK